MSATKWPAKIRAVLTLYAMRLIAWQGKPTQRRGKDMSNARDQIAQIIEDEIFLERFGGIVGMDAAADAILAALPSMIAPLVWEDEEKDWFSTSESRGFTYEIYAFDTDEDILDYTFAARALPGGAVFSAIHLEVLGRASFSDAKDACDKHKRDDFVGQLNPLTIPTLD
jgi:hypothetical protein